MEQKVSLITTVKNEGETILTFLESIRMQTRRPDEIVIVDGGSSDDTISKIKKSNLKNLKVYTKKGNRSVGRNFAIKKSSYDLIAVTDAGCILDKYWLERITKPFSKKNIQVVSGFYKPLAKSVFQKCLATYTCTMPDKLDRSSFLPSSRSVAFRKSAWLKVKGYPEELDTCEDLVFDKKLKKQKLEFWTEEKAVVSWPQRKNILSAAVQFFTYAKGDGQAHYVRKSTPLLYLRYLVGIIVLAMFLMTNNYVFLWFAVVLVFLYLLWAVLKNYKYVKNSKAIFYLPLLQIVSDFAVMLGMGYGFMRSRAII